MATRDFSWSSFLFRLILALVVVFATYNPHEPYSFYHWVKEGVTNSAEHDTAYFVLMAFVGIILLIGWTVLLRATLRSLGLLGIFLAISFFGLLIWLIWNYTGDWWSGDTGFIASYVIELTIVGVLAAGVSWSHVRRKLTGQYDIDDVEGD